jgi:murein hydrolase activator
MKTKGLAVFIIGICGGVTLLCHIGDAPLVSAQPEEQQQQDDLDSLQEQLKEKRAAYQQITGKEESILGKLREIDQQLQAAEQKLKATQQQLAQNTGALQKIEANLANLQNQYRSQHTALAKRLRAIYKMGDLGYLSSLLTFSTQANVQQQMKYLQQIAASDQKLIEEAQAGIQAIRQEKQALEHQKQQIAQVQQDIEEQSRAILRQKHQQTTLLTTIRQDKEQFKQVIAELQASAEKLDNFLDDMESSKEKLHNKLIAKGKSIIFPNNQDELIKTYGKHFQANKGKLLWPVQGKIITNFGRVKIGDTYTHYKGVDIQADNGTPFYSVFKGTIKFADWFEGYGNLIIVDHGSNYYTLYAHADEISVQSGDLVDTRQVLGKVGDTDSIKGSHLYFEIRANGKPVNPENWLATGG